MKPDWRIMVTGHTRAHRWAAFYVTMNRRGKVARQLQSSDLERANKCWIQELLGNKFLISWKQNTQSKHEGLSAKQARLADIENAVVMPTLPGNNIPDYSRVGVAEIVARTEVLATHLTEAIREKELP